MWCLGRFLPLIIGNLVPEEDERWQLFNMLLEINDIVFSPIVSEDHIGILEGLIEEHHSTFVQLYPFTTSMHGQLTETFVPLCLQNDATIFSSK